MWSAKLLCTLLLPQSGHRRQDQASLCLSSSSAWAQMIGASFSVPFFRLNVGTDDRIKLRCALLPPQRGHRRQDQTSLCPSSASAWAQEIGSSFSVPFFLLNVGTGDRIKLLCTLLPPQREIVYGYEKLVLLLIPKL